MSVKINDNITLHYIPMEKLKTSSISIYIHRPLCENEAAMNGLLPFVLKRGCKKCPSTEALAHMLDSLYGAELHGGISKKGLDQVMSFSLESISEKYTPFSEPIFDELTELAMSLLFEPVTDGEAFVKDFVDQEKKNSIEHIEGIINNKRSYAAMQCFRKMYKGSQLALSSYGTVESVNEITPQKLYAHYKKIITSSPIDIYISGDCDEKNCAEKIIKTVENMNFTKSEITRTDVFVGDGELKKHEESMDIAQGKLSMGFTTGINACSEDYYAMMVANSIFGSGAHSKLFNNVREKLSLCYYASSGLDRYTGAIQVNAGIEFENFGKAYDEILVQLRELQAGKVSELEYTSSINAIVNSLKTCFDDRYAMQSFDLSERVSGKARTLEEVIEKISAITVEQAVEASKKIKLDTVYFLKN